MSRAFLIIACCALTGCATNISGASDALIDSFGNVCLTKDGQNSKTKRALTEGWLKIETGVDANLEVVKLRASQTSINFQFQAFSSNRYRGKYLVVFSSELTSKILVTGCELYDFNASTPFDRDRLVDQFGPFDSIQRQEGYSADELTAVMWSPKLGNPQWMSQYVSKSAKFPKELAITPGSALRSATLEPPSQSKS